MKTKIYTAIKPKLLKEWYLLWNKSPYANYTNSPQWFLSVIESFEYTNYLIVAVYQKKRLIGIGALMKEKKYGIDIYTVAPTDFVCGIPFLFDFSDEKIIKSLLVKLSHIGTIYLDNIPKTTIDTITKLTTSKAITNAALNLFLPIQHDVNGKMIIAKRKKLIRDIRGVADKITLKSYSGTAKKGIDTVFAIDNLSRKHGRGYNTFEDHQMKIFYKTLTKYFKNKILLNILYYENTPIAYDIGFLIGTTYYGNQLAFIDTYAKYSPGKVLLVKLFDYLTDQGVQKIDFGSGDSYLKRSFTNESQQLYQIVLSNSNWIRIYLTLINKIKTYFFHKIQNNIKTYTMYRNVRKHILLFFAFLTEIIGIA
jgi:hypothetical protein